MELTDEIILKIDDLLFDWAFLAVYLDQIVNTENKISNQYANDDILLEYYNGIKDGKSSSQMRENGSPCKDLRLEHNILKLFIAGIFDEILNIHK